MARSDLRSFITVHDGMPDHPKIGGLSDKAFRLLVESWCWCSRHKTDGVISSRHWERSGTQKSRNELVKAGLVNVANDLFVMHDFLKHQQSKEDRVGRSESKAQAGRLAMHNRWHEARNEIKEGCEFCASKDPKPDNRSYKSTITPVITEPLQNITEVEVEVEQLPIAPMGAAPVGDTRENGPAPAGTGAANALRFVATRIGDHITPGTRTSLAFQIQKLHSQGVSDDDLAEALDRWDHRTGIGPAMLPNLVDDIRKEARGATTRAPVVGPAVNAVDARVAALLADTSFGTPNLRALPGGA